VTDSAKVIRLEPEIQRHVRARLARLPAAVHALNELGQKFLATALEVYFDSADDALFDLADKARSNQEQNTFFDSMREVRVQRKSMERRFLEKIEEAFGNLSDDDKREIPRSDGELSASALSLVQNEDLEQLVALESTIGRANREHQAILGAIAEALARILPTRIDIQSLPLGPAVICNAAMAQIKRLDVDIKAKLVLFKLFDRVVVGQQAALNKELVNCLERNGIVVSSRPTRIIEQGATISSSAARSAGEGIATGKSSAEKLPDLLNALSKMQRMPMVGESEYGLDFERILVNLHRDAGAELAISRVEKETMGLVQMLFRFILQDQGLADPFRDLIAKMQVPVLKMALLDDQFLVEKRHPARRLLNELVSVAAEWQNGSGRIEDEPLLDFMRTTVERILGQFDVNGDIFKDALADFSSFVDKERRRSALLEKRTVDAEDGKARAEFARKTVADEIELRTMAHQLPELVQRLINGPWSNVLFVTGLKFGFNSNDWAEQIKVLTDLIWSVQPCASKPDRQRLIRMIPDLIGRLRRGLDTISYNPFEMADLLAGLEEIHLARIRSEALKNETLTELKQEIPLESKANIKVEKSASLLEDDPHMQIVAGLTHGIWCDLELEGGVEMMRCRLAAIIRTTGKYIFVNRNGIKAAEKTQEELALALKSAKMRLLDHTMLFDKALESVVTSLRQNKSKSLLDLDNQ
jgi:hypothetical protein